MNEHNGRTTPHSRGEHAPREAFEHTRGLHERTGAAYGPSMNRYASRVASATRAPTASRRQAVARWAREERELARMHG